MRPSPFLIAAIAVLLVGAPFAAFAQNPINSEVQIEKLLPEFVKSPSINSDFKKKSSSRPTPWLELEVVFNRAQSPTLPKYADELTFNFYVLLNNAQMTEDRKPTMLTGTVAFTDVAQGRGMHATAFVSPKTLERLFDGKVPGNVQQAVTDFGVTVGGPNGLVAISTLKGRVVGDKGWWDNAEAFTTKAGAILSKDKTPFAPLEWDYYEAVKPATGN